MSRKISSRRGQRRSRFEGMCGRERKGKKKRNEKRQQDGARSRERGGGRDDRERN